MENTETRIGIYSWWQQVGDSREFVVINFSGFEVVTLVEILEKYTRESKRVPIEKFLKAVESGKFKRIGQI